MPTLRAWHRGRIVIVGDAAHAPTPTSGQGASLAIEDTVVLAKRLRDLPDPAFARFEEARRPGVERIVKWTARTNRSKAPGPVGQSVPQAFDYHIDWETAATATAA